MSKTRVTEPLSVVEETTASSVISPSRTHSEGKKAKPILKRRPSIDRLQKERSENVRKIEIIENITKKKLPPVEKSKKVTKDSNPTVDQLKVALLTPYKMNLNHGQVASNIARYAGTFFVLIGAFLTVYNMDGTLYLFGQSQTAQTTAFTCLPGSECLTNTTSSGVPAGTNTTPDVDIQIELGTNTTNTIVGTVPIHITVPLASRVDLMAVSKTGNQVVQVGTASRVSDLVWRTYWQTQGVTDAEYTLKAVVTNQFGTYTREKSTVYAVLNHPVDTTPVVTPTPTPVSAISTTTEPTTAASTTSNTGVVSTSTPVASPTVLTNTTPLKVTLTTTGIQSGFTQIKTIVEGAGSVKHYIRPRGDMSITTLGSAVLTQIGEWKYSFDTTRVPDGIYDIKTQALFLNGTSNVTTLEAVQIVNAKTTTGTSTEKIPTTPAISPVATMEVPGLELPISIVLPVASPLSKIVDAYITVNGATFVEMYVTPQSSLVPRFVGLGAKQTDTVWKYRLDTTLLPNGSYSLFAKVRHQYGDSISEKTSITIRNVAVSVVPPDKIAYADTLTSVSHESEQILNPVAPKQDEFRIGTTSSETITELADEEGKSEIEKNLGDAYTREVDDTLIAFEKDSTRIMEEYARALRINDTEKTLVLLEELNKRREDVIKTLSLDGENPETMRTLNDHTGTIIKDLRERTERSESVLKERLGENISKDSDSDSITDFDEVNLYKTDPFNADSDSDGFIDGIEVLGGFDPKNAEPEANIAYESPKENGVTRDDLLTVDHITTVTDDNNKESLPKAHLGGKALPYSFVTLYIFSTPIVITVKTDKEGNWSYIFDKELDDGDHEVYVGITDNAGKIVAKSNPLSFVKTAEAFTPVSANSGVAKVETPEEPALLNGSMMLAIGSIAIVALGLVLILLGLHVKPKEEVLQPA